MVAAVLTLYFVGTALSFLAVLYGIVDSFGGLMYAQDHHYLMDLDQQTRRPLSSGSHRRGSPPTKNICS